jgi:hypothetical protein
MARESRGQGWAEFIMVHTHHILTFALQVPLAQCWKYCTPLHITNMGPLSREQWKSDCPNPGIQLGLVLWMGPSYLRIGWSEPRRTRHILTPFSSFSREFNLNILFRHFLRYVVENDPLSQPSSFVGQRYEWSKSETDMISKDTGKLSVLTVTWLLITN